MTAVDPTLLTLLAAAFGAGTIDAIVGGGGLLQLPALFAALPTVAPAALLGTSKLAGFAGTSSAAIHFLRTVRLPFRALLAGLAIAFVSALAGAVTVTHMHAMSLRPLVPILLLVVLVITVRNKRLGEVHAPRGHSVGGHLISAVSVAGIGFYDGFFGPGTGSFLMMFAVRRLGFDFVHAAATARVLNVATNLAALAWFLHSGNILLGVGLAMGVANIAGAQVGARLALRRGTRFVRGMLIVVVCALIARTGWDALQLIRQ
jgi:uncharacterized membrane protein YfcA